MQLKINETALDSSEVQFSPSICIEFSSPTNTGHTGHDLASPSVLSEHQSLESPKDSPQLVLRNLCSPETINTEGYDRDPD